MLLSTSYLGSTYYSILGLCQTFSISSKRDLGVEPAGVIVARALAPVFTVGYIGTASLCRRCMEFQVPVIKTCHQDIEKKLGYAKEGEER